MCMSPATREQPVKAGMTNTTKNANSSGFAKRPDTQHTREWMNLTGYTIVFDLDGTLIDTAPDLIAAVNHVLQSRGYAPIAEDQLRPQISFGGRRMIEFGLARQGGDANDGELDALFRRFIAHYSRNIAIHSRPYPGLVTCLDRLAQAGARLAVCTNKRADLARQLLDELELADRFAALTGRDTFAVHKPNAGHYLGTVEKAGGSPASSVMIGDSATDVKTARAAGVPVIGVTFGYTDVPVSELGCDAIISHYDEFPSALETVLHQTS